jgi:diguanylate cyclase (GGDEF)-like protein
MSIWLLLPEIVFAVIVFRDVSAARALALQITHSAEHDFLTGGSPPNRVLFNDRVNQSLALAARNTKRVAVLFLDLDGFKHINDSLGHAIGDKLLQSIAKRLVDCVRASDTVSRQGGDEFVVLLSEVEHSEDAAISARRMLQSIAQAHPVDRHDLHVTTSIGVSVYPDDGLDAETLIKNADIALHQAKEQGRQGYPVFQAGNEHSRCGAPIDRGKFAACHRAPRIRAALPADYRFEDERDYGRGSVDTLDASHARAESRRLNLYPMAEDCGLILPIGRLGPSGNVQPGASLGGCLPTAGQLWR